MNTLLLNYGKCILTILKCRLAPWFLTNLKRNAWSNQFKRQHHFRWQRTGWGAGAWALDTSGAETGQRHRPWKSRSRVRSQEPQVPTAQLLFSCQLLSALGSEVGPAQMKSVEDPPPCLLLIFHAHPSIGMILASGCVGTQTIRSHIYF